MKQKVMDVCVWVLLISFVLLGVFNLFTGVVSYIDEAGEFHNGPLYISNYIVPLFLMTFILITAIDRKNNYTKEQFKAIIFFIVLVLGGVAMDAYQSANNLLNIINDILDFSKVESGKMSLFKEPLVKTYQYKF